MRTMSDGKRSGKRDIVIQSIKPTRPNFTHDKKFVSVKEFLVEWDKLDAYYRGQILKLKAQFKSKIRPSSPSPKTFDATKSKEKSRRRSSSKKSSSKRSISSGGTHLKELFGDENVPYHDSYNSADSELENDDFHDSDSIILDGYLQNSDKKIKGKKLKNKLKTEGSIIKNEVIAKSKEEQEDENYLSIPRDNIRIEFAISLKKRIPLQRKDKCNPELISPIKVEPYKPPVAIGLNGVHIQKILYHKSDGVNHTSPTTTAPTPEKPPDSGSISSRSSSPAMSQSSSSSLGNPSSSTNAIMEHCSIPETFMNSQKDSHSNNGNKQVNSVVKSGEVRARSLKVTTTTLVSPNKRKLVQDDGEVSKERSPNNGPVSSTTTTTRTVNYNGIGKTGSMSSAEGHTEAESNNKAVKKYIKDKRLETSMETLTLTPESDEKDKRSHCHPPQIAGVTSVTTPASISSMSITDKIITKSDQLPGELQERERRRRVESLKRKQYALLKGDEQKLLDSVDASLKALEMISTYSLLSPIRSPI